MFSGHLKVTDWLVLSPMLQVPRLNYNRAFKFRHILHETINLSADQHTVDTMTSCVVAYSGGLDTSVILGWLMDQGYECHAVYVDLGQPCEDRAEILKKAEDAGAKTARIVDVR